MERRIPHATFAPDRALFEVADDLERRLQEFVKTLDTAGLLEQAQAARSKAEEALQRASVLENSRDEALAARSDAVAAAARAEAIRQDTEDARSVVRQLAAETDIKLLEFAHWRQQALQEVVAQHASLTQAGHALSDAQDQALKSIAANVEELSVAQGQVMAGVRQQAEHILEKLEAQRHSVADAQVDGLQAIQTAADSLLQRLQAQQGALEEAHTASLEAMKAEASRLQQQLDTPRRDLEEARAALQRDIDGMLTVLASQRQDLKLQETQLTETQARWEQSRAAAEAETSTQAASLQAQQQQLEVLARDVKELLTEAQAVQASLQAEGGRAPQGSPFKFAAITGILAVLGVLLLFAGSQVYHPRQAQRLTAQAELALTRAQGGTTLAKRGAARRAVALCDEALGHDRSQAKIHLVLARAYGDFYRDNILALRELTLAQAIAEKNGHPGLAEEAERLRPRYPVRKGDFPNGPAVRSNGFPMRDLAEKIRLVGMGEHQTGQVALRAGRVNDVLRYNHSARVAFKTATTLDPSFAEARYNYAVSLAEEGRVDEALNQLRRAHRDDGKKGSPLCVTIRNFEKWLEAKGHTATVSDPSEVAH